MFQQGRGGKKAVPRCDAASRWGELRGCAPRDTGAKIPFDLPIRGVPLFVEELTKAIVESGHLKDVDGHYELTGSLSTFAIPATLQDSLMARLDRLMTGKVIAQLGATIGRQFSYALLQAVAQLNDRTLHEELHRLVEAELLYQRGVPPQATYTFKHALIQDA